MPLIKPGQWSANPADIDPQFLSFWSGLVFCAPLWERSGPPIDLITKTFPTVTGSPTWVNTTTGIAAQGSTGDGWVWAAHETHDRIPAADAWTFIVLTRRYGQNDNSFIFGYGVDTVLAGLDAAGLWGDTAERLRPVIGPTLLNFSATTPLDTSILQIVRWDGGTGEAFQYGLDGQLLKSTSAAATTNVTTGGQFGLNDSADGAPGASQDYVIAYAWDRFVTDEEIRLLLSDPFGPIRPAVQFSASTEITVGGSLLSRSPTFPTGSVNPGNVTTVGTLLSRSPTFPTGTVSSEISIGGVLLSRAPSFPTGVVTTEITVGGVLLTRSPTFPTGTVTSEITVAGILLARSPTFPVGSVALVGPQTITGVLLSRSPTFPTGSVALVVVHVSGSVVVVLDGSTGDAGLAPSLASVDLDPSTAFPGLDRSAAKA